MEAEEHFYTDDPSIGPADARTTLENVDYFLIGNGHMTAVIQVCLSGKATPLGVLLMHPEIFGRKRNALSFHPREGLASTLLQISGPGIAISPDKNNLEGRWDKAGLVPTVLINWGDDNIRIIERFFCPDRETPRLLREIRVLNGSSDPAALTIKTGLQSRFLENALSLMPGEEKLCYLEYRLIDEDSKLVASMNWAEPPAISEDAARFWRGSASFESDSQDLNHLFDVSKSQLSSNIAHSGKLDGSIWQYNLEWVRDQSMIALGLCMAGQFDLAGTILDRILTHFVTDAGDTVDSSKQRPFEDVELDQNGELLYVLRSYVYWSGDLSVVRRHWPKIMATANFPLQAVFRHPDVFMLHNQREYWERHALYGIEDGMELTSQFFVSVGLSSAADLARLLGHGKEALAWEEAAGQIKSAMLSDPRFALVENGHFIKRRKVNGEVQREVVVGEDSGLPDGIPIVGPGRHDLNPDTLTSLPIAFEFIDPSSDLARKTMSEIEYLWNQSWQGGGYSRYNVTSEPDSPGPWPFASVFVARAYFEMGEDEKVWRIFDWLKKSPGGKSGSWFEFYGPRPVPPYPQVGIVPWTWAEIQIFFLHHLLGIRPLWDKLQIRPRLLSGCMRTRASMRIRGHRLAMKLARAESPDAAEFRVNGEPHPYGQGSITIEMPDHDVEIEVLVP